MKMLSRGDIRIKDGKIGLPESADEDQQQGNKVENRVLKIIALCLFRRVTNSYH